MSLVEAAKSVHSPKRYGECGASCTSHVLFPFTGISELFLLVLALQFWLRLLHYTHPQIGIGDGQK